MTTRALTRNLIRDAVRDLIRGEDGGVPVSPTVSNTAFDYGVLSLALAGARTITPTSGTITSIVIDSESGGTSVYDTTGATIRLAAGQTAATKTLQCTATFSDASTDTFQATITGVADEYSVRTDAEWVTVEALLGGVGSNSVMFRTIGTYANGINLQPSAVTGTITLRGESNTSRANIQNLFMSGFTANGNLTVKWLDTSNPRVNAFNAGIRYGGVGGTLTVQNCSGTGPFTPETNTDKGHYWAKIRVINATAEPTIGESIAEGAGNAREIFGFDDLGGNSYDIYFDDQVIATAAAWLVGDTLTETTTAETFEVSVVRSGGLPTAQVADAIASNGGGVVWDDIIITDCDYNHYTDGINLKSNDILTVTGSSVSDCYRDAFKFNAVDFASPPIVTLTELLAENFHNQPTDRDNPHVDCIQFNGNSLTADWTGFVIRNCEFNIGVTRCNTIQLIFIEGIPSPYYFTGDITNNIGVSKNTPHGVSIDRAKNCGIHNNTMVHADPSNASGEASTLSVRITTDGGGNVAQNNVSDLMTIPSATVSNNIALGQGNVTNYQGAFDPTTFTTPVSLAASRIQYTPEGSGSLLAGATYVLGDAGCIDSNSDHFAWNASSIADITPPVFLSGSPADNATGVAITTNPTITFTEANTLSFGTTKTFTIRNVTGSSDTQVFSTATDIGSGPGKMSLAGNTVTLEPTPDLANNNAYSIRWTAGAVKDDSGHDVAVNSSDTLLNWTTVAAAAVMDVNFDNTPTWINMLHASDAGAITATKTFCVAGKFRLTDTASSAYLFAVGVDTYMNADTDIQVRGEDSAGTQIFNVTGIDATLSNTDEVAFVLKVTDTTMTFWSGVNATAGASSGSDTYTAMSNNFKMPDMVNAVNGSGGLAHDFDLIGGYWYQNAVPTHASDQALWDLFFDSSNDWVPTSGTVGGVAAHFYQDGTATEWNALNGTTGTVTDV